MPADENFTDQLETSYGDYKRNAMAKQLSQRGELTFAQLRKILDHPEHGPTLSTIRLQDLFDHRLSASADEVEKAPPAKKVAKTPPAKKAAKTPPAKKAAKAPPAKKAAKAPPAKKAAKGGKADKGKPKPRLDYETGCREVLAALKAASSPIGRGEIEKATGYSGVQVRAFCKRLAATNKVSVTGNGGRSTRYSLK